MVRRNLICICFLITIFFKAVNAERQIITMFLNHKIFKNKDIQIII
jgi:hypothetical protein